MAAPRMAGLLVKVFGWLLEMKIIGAFVVEILKRNNLVHKVLDLVSSCALMFDCQFFFMGFIP